jgi:hypothetical protein
MTGGLMQLVAYGAQDIYLTGNPMITYFKVVYRRHTNFAMESIEQTFNGTVGFGNKVTALISRNGDLVSGLTLEVDLPAIAANGDAWTNDVGHHLIEECTVEIGGQQIDKHYGDWLEIWAQLTVPASQRVGYRDMIGQSPLAANGHPGTLQRITGGVAATRRIYVPLQFWFCRNVGLALPLIALQYHEVKVSVKFRTYFQTAVDAQSVAASTGTPTLSASLWADYIYLDTDERRRFAQVSHEYLIEQLQLNEKSFSAAGSTTVDLTFNHPVKELVWVCRSSDNTTDNQYSNYTTAQAVLIAYEATITAQANIDANTSNQYMKNPTSGVNPVTDAKLKLNGHDRFATRQGRYFNQMQTCRHHTSIPESPGINVYSFALKPEDHQPSGTCNFSRIDNAQLVLTIGTLTAGTVKVYAVNYNVLRIMSGMGGLAYSN